ncbi:MAG TPA: ATP-binding protein [Anaeromyxobacteraceae bacterium]|nr:ATP-binding protein [Anaeromyxobacteraceae bacterium]
MTAVDGVGELIASTARVGPAEPVRRVADRFFGDPALDALAVVDGDDRPVGLVTRSRLLLRLARGFGQELYAKKPVARVAQADPLAVDAATPVAEAVARALARPADAVYDEVIVVDGAGRYLGLASVQRLVQRQGLALERSRVEREAAEARAADLEALERLRAQFLAHTAHELRSPANAVVGVAELMRRQAEKGAWPQVAARLPLLQRAAMTLRSTVNNILDLSKLEAGRTEVELGPVELGSLLDDVAATARLLCGEKPVAVVVDAAGAPAEIVSDGQKLRQIALNLASNAAKFTEAGQVTIGAAAEGGALRLWVSDTGIGIRDEDLARLFTPFGQLEDARDRRHEGSGLGLVITRSMAQLLGGRVEVASRHGQGTTFTVTIPEPTTWNAAPPSDPPAAALPATALP